MIPILKIAFEFPRAVYQGLTIYLLISIGWHGGEELAVLSGKVLDQALGLIVVGFLCNFAIGFVAHFILRILGPNVFATFGMCMAMIFSHAIHMPFQLGSYVLFAVLCGAASYIAVPAIQRIAIPEASQTLPLAASLGLTFSYNVTIGIPVYLLIAQHLLTAFPMSGV